MFHDDPRIKYENPPPPADYKFDFDADPVFFTFHYPQKTFGVNFIKIDFNLIPKSLIGSDETVEEQLTTSTGQKDERANKSEETGRSGLTIVKRELNAEDAVNRNTTEEAINKIEASKGKDCENIGLKKLKIKSEPIENDSNVVTHHDSDKSTSKKKNVESAKTSALESISKSYSNKSNSDSDSERHKKSKSSSHREKSHSKKLSAHKKKDKDSRDNTSQSDVILVKEEVLSDRDDDDYRYKIKSSKSSRKKNGSSSKHRLDDDRHKGRHREVTRKRRYDGSSSDDSRDYSDDDIRSRYSEDSRDSRSNVKREIKQESGITSCYAPNDYYCDVCKLILNSETTFSSHMAGKRHKKAVRLKSEQDVAKSQILDIEGRTKKPASRHPTPQPRERAYELNVEESQSCPKPPDTDRIPLYDEKAKIQDACDDAKLLILGLDYVQEIRGYEETKYFCELCSAQCVSNSIVKHLVGFKHHLSCIKVYCPRTYDYIQDFDRRDKQVDRDIKRRLEDALIKYGRGRIKVFKDKKRTQYLPQSFDPYQPSTSRQDPDALIRKVDEAVSVIVTDEDCLSREFSDFYCKVCDSHMNNHSMWESHARGKRHAKNKKKAPEGAVSDGNYIEAPPGTISHLEEMLHDQISPNEFIVGLNFIKENQGENGDLYNCFLCGSVCPTMDIIDHLFLRKHKEKYLEKMKFNGCENAINEISLMPISEYAKESLINEECDRVLQIVGRGRPVIAIAKKTF